MFEVLHRDGLSRIGRFEVHGKQVETPALMPVINPNIIVIPPDELKNKFHIDALITNSYIIKKDALLREKALKEGLHKLLNFDGIIMTDSGTFQSHVYGDVDLDPVEILKFQKDMGTDIATILDIFSEPEFSYNEAENAINATYERAKCAREILGDTYVAGPIQGSLFPDLREKSARLMNSLNLDYYPIGGVVPLLESYKYSDIVNIVMPSKLNIDYGKPVHLFGAGHPMIFAIAALMGMDFFDSSSYVKYARDDRIIFPDSTRYLSDLKYVPYPSPYLDRYDLDEIKQMDKNERFSIISRHNLYVTVQELERVKGAIFEGSIWEYAEERCRSHPYLYQGLLELYKYGEKLEKFESLSRTHPFYYTGAESLKRPMVSTLEKRIIRNYKYKRKSCIVIDWKNMDRAMKFIKTLDSHFLVKTPFGYVPYELLFIYPIVQSPLPNETYCIENLEKIVDSLDFDILISWLKNVPENLTSEKEFVQEQETRNLDILRIKAVADYQFGFGASDVLLNGEITIVKSKNTGMIRNIFLNGKHILSMRNDGFFTLKIEGARLLHNGLKFPGLRTVVTPESEEFNRKGKNVFARFIVDMDPELRPMDETLVVNENDELIGVGRTFFSRDEALTLKKGMVVELRENLS
ncbi:MAG: tRNA guanosine(15) transglycosylase TgtA [Thermoplasmata archaeon]